MFRLVWHFYQNWEIIRQKYTGQSSGRKYDSKLVVIKTNHHKEAGKSHSMGCASRQIFNYPFSSTATLESVAVSEYEQFLRPMSDLGIFTSCTALQFGFTAGCRQLITLWLPRFSRTPCSFIHFFLYTTFSQKENKWLYERFIGLNI